MSDELLSATEFCKLAHIDRRTLRRWLADSETVAALGAFRTKGRGGGEWRIPTSGLERVTVSGRTRPLNDQRGSAEFFGARCAGTKRDGEACGGIAVAGTKFCHWHQGQAGTEDADVRET